MHELDDHMDDLFRRAAEDYPLNPGTGDFNKVLAALSQDTEKKKRGGWMFAWLLFLLIPLGWLGYLYLPVSHDRAEPVGQTATIKKPATDRAGVTGEPKASSEKTTQDQFATGDRLTPESHAKLENATPKAIDPEQPSILTAKNSAVTLPGPIASSFDAQANPQSPINRQSAEAAAEKKNESAAVQPDKRTTESPEAETALPPRNSIRKAPRFYAGLSTGLDLTSVRLQAISQLGFNANLALGVKVGKKVSIETGVGYVKKFYYTEGQYFSTKNIAQYLAANTTIENVGGSCSMFEWPVSVRLDLKKRGSNTLSVSAGIVSYFIGKESYHYVLNTSGWTNEKDRDYTGGTPDWAGAASATFTWDHQFRGGGKLRVEPYARIPLRGMGTGQIAIYSGGINVGYIKPLF